MGRNVKREAIEWSGVLAAYASTHNALAVEKSFGVSRYKIKKRWEELSAEQRGEYEGRFVEARAAAVEELSGEVKAVVAQNIEASARIKEKLLAELEKCVSRIELPCYVSAEDGSEAVKPSVVAMTIKTIKEAATALKNLDVVAKQDSSSPNSEGDNFYRELIDRQKLQHPS